MISAILLAAGESKRMKDENKLVKNFKGIPLIKYSVDNILSSQIESLIIVLGYQKEKVEQIIEKNKKIKLTFNKNFEKGMSTSIQEGISNLHEKTEFFFICHADMPFVNPNIYNSLIKERNKNDIIVPTYKGQQENPILFSKVMKSEIMSVDGDFGAKKIINLNKNRVFNIEFNDENFKKNFNTKKNFNF